MAGSNDKNLEQLLAQNLHLLKISSFIDEVETEFLKSEELQPSLWLRYIDDIFLYGLME